MTGETGGGVESGQPAADGTIQDIMLVYTPAVRASYGGSTATTESALLDAIVATNQSYIDSLIDNQLNVVHMVEVPYTETGDMGVTLSRLRLTTDGWMDDVHGLRNTYAADLAVLPTGCVKL